MGSVCCSRRSPSWVSDEAALDYAIFGNPGKLHPGAAISQCGNVAFTCCTRPRGSLWTPPLWQQQQEINRRMTEAHEKPRTPRTRLDLARTNSVGLPELEFSQKLSIHVNTCLRTELVIADSISRKLKIDKSMQCLR